MTTTKTNVRIIEVGLRDGLQNEKVNLSLDHRKELFLRLVGAGISHIEAGAFVSPKWVPAMAVSEDLFLFINKEMLQSTWLSPLRYSALIPNEEGIERALKTGVEEIAIFAACTETFSQKNTNCSIDESFRRLEKVSKIAHQNNIKVRGYLSTCFGCPFEGPVAIQQVKSNVNRMKNLGVYEVSLGDTIGLASAGDVERMLSSLLSDFNPDFLAGHFHDTRGQAVANVLKAFEMGLRCFDSSLGGLGGCPYAPGATGNVATEDVVFLFQSLGVHTGINLDRLIEVNHWLSQVMEKNLPSKVSMASNQGYVKHRGCFI